MALVDPVCKVQYPELQAVHGKVPKAPLPQKAILHVHVDWPVSELDAPIGHVKHEEAPDDMEYELTAQDEHGLNPLGPN